MPLPPPSLRRALLAQHPARGKLYAPEVQAAVVEFAQVRRGEGATWLQIAIDLGMRFDTVRRWCVPASAGRALKRVEVVDEIGASPGRLCIVCPSGHQLEGLAVHDAIAVLRALA